MIRHEFANRCGLIISEVHACITLRASCPCAMRISAAPSFFLFLWACNVRYSPYLASSGSLCGTGTPGN